MTEPYEAAPAATRPEIDASRLAAGGAATAVVAALITLAGILVGRGIFGVDLLAPKGAGVWGDADTGWYAVGAAATSLAATVLIYLLILFTPRPMRFFGWVVSLATLVAMTAPFVTDQDLGSRIFTALLNLVLGVAIGTLVAGTARTAIRPAALPYGGKDVRQG